VSALELRLAEQIHASNTALLAQLERLTGPLVLTNQQRSIPPYATIAIEGGKAAPEPPIDLLNDDPEARAPRARVRRLCHLRKSHPCRLGTSSSRYRRTSPLDADCEVLLWLS
jgi:hypothetical protein